MKNIFKIFLVILSVCTFISCSDDPVQNTVTPPTSIDTSVNNFKYPYKTNSLWYYSTRNFVTNLRPDSISVYFPTDTTLGYGASGFIKDTIINQDTLKLMRNSHSTEGHAHTTLELYKQSESGLIRYAFYSDGINFGPFRPLNNNLKYTFHGKTFGSLNELKKAFDPDKSFGDTTLFFDDPPVKVIMYPITRNVQWDLINYGTTRVTKKYTDYETVTVPAGTFYCIKIKRDVYYNSPNPDTNYFYYDYFSKDGMIKRDFLLKDIQVSNNEGETIGYLDVKEESFLNIYIQ